MKANTIHLDFNTLYRSVFSFCLLFLIIVQSWETVKAQENGQWPCFHGAYRDNKSRETGLSAQWPSEGPKLLWTVSGLGEGYSSVAVADGRIYTAGMTDKQTFVFAFDLNGKRIWKKPNGPAWETTMRHAMSYTGSRSTPTVDDGAVYHLGELGRLAAFDAETGSEKWSMELRDRFEAEIPEYGYSESILIEGDVLYCNPAGNKGFMACLNKRNGDVIWTNTDIPGTVGFSSPILAEFGGYRQLIALSSNCVYGMDAETGERLWSVPYENQRSNNATDAIYHDGFVFVSSGYGKGSRLIKLTFSENKIVPETVWHTPLMDNHHGGVILHNGYLYGSGHEARGWFCLDFNTGEQMWNTPGKGSLVFADGGFYCLEERGTMKWIGAGPENYEVFASFDVPDGGKGMYWAHPVVCGGRLYIRHADMLFAYDVENE